MSKQRNISHISLYQYPSLRVIFGFLVLLLYEFYFSIPMTSWIKRSSTITLLIYGFATYIIFTACFYSAGRIYQGVKNIQFRLTFLVLIICAFTFFDTKRFLFVGNQSPEVLVLKKNTHKDTKEDYTIYFREDKTCRIEIIKENSLGYDMSFFEARYFQVPEKDTIRIFTHYLIDSKGLPYELVKESHISYQLISIHDMKDFSRRRDYDPMYFSILSQHPSF